MDSKPARKPSHECGMCDGPLSYDGQAGEYATWVCAECDWWHIGKDCCHVS